MQIVNKNKSEFNNFWNKEYEKFKKNGFIVKRQLMIVFLRNFQSDDPTIVALKIKTVFSGKR